LFKGLNEVITLKEHSEIIQANKTKHAASAFAINFKLIPRDILPVRR
jgi:hypothetical protein